LLQTAFQRAHVFMRVPQKLSRRQQAAFDNAGMVAFIADDVFALSHKSTDYSQVDLETCAV